MRRPAPGRAVLRVRAVACSHCSGQLGSAGWCFSAGARRRRVVPRRVTWVLVSCVRAWPHSMGEIQMCWSWVCWRALQRMRSTMASWTPCPGLARTRRALTVSLVLLSCRLYQRSGVSAALPWRVARRRSRSLMVAGVRGGCPGSGGVWRGGRSRSNAATSMCVWRWAGLVGLGGVRWSRGREVAGPGVSGVVAAGGSLGGCSSWMVWRCLGGLWTEIEGVCGVQSRLVDLWVMHSMVMDET